MLYADESMHSWTHIRAGDRHSIVYFSVYLGRRSAGRWVSHQQCKSLEFSLYNIQSCVASLEHHSDRAPGISKNDHSPSTHSGPLRSIGAVPIDLSHSICIDGHTGDLHRRIPTASVSACHTNTGSAETCTRPCSARGTP